jgi:copper chaperone CopZ
VVALPYTEDREAGANGKNARIIRFLILDPWGICYREAEVRHPGGHPAPLKSLFRPLPRSPTMKLLKCVSAVAALFLLAATVHAEEVTIKGSHLCCGMCYKAAEKAVGKVDGASITFDKTKKTMTVSAGDAKTAQKAVDALAAAGFHGKTGNKKIKFKNDSGVKKGSVKRLELVGVHNCCGGCNKTIKKAIASVKGVSSDNAKVGGESIVIEGDFDGAALVAALYKAGFHGTAKKDKK